jgi:hypothetical protein
VLRISPLTPQSNNAANPEAREVDGWLSRVVSVVKREARVRPIERRERALVRQGHVRRTQPRAPKQRLVTSMSARRVVSRRYHPDSFRGSRRRRGPRGKCCLMQQRADCRTELCCRRRPRGPHRTSRPRSLADLARRHNLPRPEPARNCLRHVERFPSGESPIPLGVIMPPMTSRISLPSARAQ